jgi:hypothetical protein
MLGALSEVRRPQSERGLHRQHSDSLAPDSAAVDEPLERRREPERPHGKLNHALPKAGQTAQSGLSSHIEPCRADLAEAQRASPQQVWPWFNGSSMLSKSGSLMCNANADSSDKAIFNPS